MKTLMEYRSECREKINELSPQFFENHEVDRWINDAAKDIARRSETIQEYSTNITVVSEQHKFKLPRELLRIHRVEFLVGDQTYVVNPSTYAEMDQYWGTNRTITSAYPTHYVVWGRPGALEMQIYPAPSAGGQLVLYFYRLPRPAIEHGATVEVPEGWEDLVALYVEYQAKRKDRDPSWQDAKALYEETLQHMIDTTRQYWEGTTNILHNGRRLQGWLVEMADDW